MTHLVSLLIVVALNFACSAKNSGSESSGSSSEHLTLNFKINSNASSMLPGSQAAEEPLPLVFNSVAVSSFYYRPQLGSAQQIGQEDGAFHSDDWSAWRMLPVNANNNREFYLPNGGALNLRRLAVVGDTGIDLFYRDITNRFIEQDGVFRADVTAVSARLGLVNQSRAVCGAFGHNWIGEIIDIGTNILYWQMPCETRFIRSSYDNSILTFPKILFVRRDWFSSPIQLQYNQNNSARLSCFTADIALTAFQVEVLDSLLSSIEDSMFGGWEPGMYQPVCPGAVGSYGHITIVPYKDDVPTIQFSALKVPQVDTLTPDGNLIPNEPSGVSIGQSLNIDVSFDVVPSLFVDWDSFNNSNATSDIILNRGQNGAPYGVSLGFSIVKPAVLEVGGE
ncbi:MAG: hypothetical protein IPJ84_04545 [Bdellovibrionales bacterium]|nr:hypothetical protein [Bdellovibrionales bacterium]